MHSGVLWSCELNEDTETCTSVSLHAVSVGSHSSRAAKTAFYDEVCSFLVIAWALHYLPFFLMQRQLFLHHYLPSLWFAVLTFCAVFDFATSRLRPRTRIQIASVVLILVVWTWSHYSSLTYAGDWTRGKCEKAKWLRSWDFSW